MLCTDYPLSESTEMEYRYVASYMKQVVRGSQKGQWTPILSFTGLREGNHVDQVLILFAPLVPLE